MNQCDTCGREFDTQTGLHIHESVHTDVDGCQMIVSDTTCLESADVELTFQQPDGSELTKQYCEEHADLAARSDSLVNRERLS